MAKKLSDEFASRYAKYHCEWVGCYLPPTHTRTFREHYGPFRPDRVARGYDHLQFVVCETHANAPITQSQRTIVELEDETLTGGGSDGPR